MVTTAKTSGPCHPQYLRGTWGPGCVPGWSVLSGVAAAPVPQQIATPDLAWKMTCAVRDAPLAGEEERFSVVIIGLVTSTARAAFNALVRFPAPPLGAGHRKYKCVRRHQRDSADIISDRSSIPLRFIMHTFTELTRAMVEFLVGSVQCFCEFEFRELDSTFSATAAVLTWRYRFYYECGRTSCPGSITPRSRCSLNGMCA